MQYEHIEFELSENLAILHLNRPAVLNSLNEAMLQELLHAGKRIESEDAIRGLLITGNGKGFCAGADLGNVDRSVNPTARAARGEQVAMTMQRLFNPVVSLYAQLNKPVVSAVNGVAAGGGMGLALCADVVIAAESASFVQVFIPQLGIVPDMGSTWFLPRLIGSARATGMAMTGQKVPARQALEWGMIWDVVADHQLLESAENLAKNLAQGPTLGIAVAKQAFRVSAFNSLDHQLQVEQDAQLQCCASEDFGEGVSAFIEKRLPNFSGC